MRVENMEGKNGRAIPNQFIIRAKSVSEDQCACDVVYFQSYKSVIVKKTFGKGNEHTYLDKTYWDYSRTTSKYRNQFLNETTKETQRKIDAGIYELVDLN